MSHILSPDTDTFSTPPTTPVPSMDQIRPSLSRRSSRPSSLHINQAEWTSDIVLEENSPKVSKKQHAALSPPDLAHDRAITAPQIELPTIRSPPQDSREPPRPIRDHHKPMDSPCFVHSHLDKGASLTDWLRNKQHALVGDHDVGVAKSLHDTHGILLNQPLNTYGPLSPPASTVVESDDEDGVEFGSLTKQLAETAAGVREMSKQLGQCSRILNTVHPLILTCLQVVHAFDLISRLFSLLRKLGTIV